MIQVGNFFFRYRNFLFIFLYLLLFLPSPPLFGNWMWAIVIGLIITVTGQLIRGVTIGLAYIVRGGKDGKVYADDLVTQGIFNHCRNPLYVGNILMLLGVGVLSNSLVYVLIVMPLFMLIYQAIVLAEENYLINKFNGSYVAYCKRVNRWIPSLAGISDTFRSMEFRWKRWILKEYNTQFVWLTGITLILLFKYQLLTTTWAIVIIVLLGLLYLFVRYLKKSGKMKE